MYNPALMSIAFFMILLDLPIEIHAKVWRITNQKGFKKILRKADGLPVVVDFYSDTCGPCRMIAPVYDRMSKEFRGKAIFTKVNVAMDNVGVSIRSMPTFQFYYNEKKKDEFSGASEQRLRSILQGLVQKAKANNFEVTETDLKAFYQKHDPEKVSTVPKIIKKFSSSVGGWAALVKRLRKKYGKGPNTQPRKWPRTRAGGSKKKLKDFTIDELKEEVERRAELNSQNEGSIELPKQRTRMKKLEKVVVIGGGPAGLSAAIYAGRAGLRPVVVAPDLGGQLMSKGVDVENYPGLLRSTGTTMIDLMRAQAARFQTEFEYKSVTSVNISQHPFIVDANNTIIRTQTIIIATGADSKWLGVEGEEEHKGLGVSSCATCDGFLFRDKPVLVVGGGDTAMEEALVLARTSSHVTIVHRRDQLRASLVLQNAAFSHRKISFRWNTTVKKFISNSNKDALHSVLLQDVNSGDTETIRVDGAFVAIGHIPNTKLFEKSLDMNEAGYINTIGRSTHTSKEGVFASGDVADPVYRQAISSGGTGAMAALDAERWLSENSARLGSEPPMTEMGIGDVPHYGEWRTKELKRLMRKKKISAHTCVEKRDYINALLDWHLENPSG